MKIKSVRRYPAPHLPTREFVDQHPELLRLLPRRWQHSPAVLTALMGAGLLLQSAGSVLAERSAVLRGKVAMPVFVSESEARRIVVEEAKKAGIEFASDSRTLDIPLSSLNRTTETKPRTGTTRITLDGTDAKLGVSYEYVSEKDAEVLSARLGHAVSPKNAAAAIKAEGRHALKGKVLAIPAVSAYSKEQADHKLRAQVKDFLKWLKAQGVI